MLDIGIHYGWASVGDSTEVFGMVMSYGWNPYYKNEKKTAVCWHCRWTTLEPG